MFQHAEPPLMSLLWAACGLCACSGLGESQFCLRSEENAPGFAAEGESFVLKSLIKISPAWFPFAHRGVDSHEERSLNVRALSSAYKTHILLEVKTQWRWWFQQWLTAVTVQIFLDPTMRMSQPAVAVVVFRGVEHGRSLVGHGVS